MTKLPHKSLIALLLLTLFACRTNESHLKPDAPEADGGIAGNGLEDDFSHSNAWFADSTRSVRACIRRSDDFPIGKAQLSQLVHQTWNQWIDYIRERQPEILAGIATKLDLHSRCNSSHADLAFYFGERDDRVRVGEARHTKALGFSLREAYSDEENWGSGLLYIPAITRAMEKEYGTWTEEGSARLHGVLLHEIGHVLGFSHVRGTIMDNFILAEVSTTTIGDRLKSDDLKMLKKIDHDRQLLMKKATENYDGPFYTRERNPSVHEETNKIYQKLFGRAAPDDFATPSRVEWSGKKLRAAIVYVVGKPEDPGLDLEDFESLLAKNSETFRVVIQRELPIYEASHLSYYSTFSEKSGERFSGTLFYSMPLHYEGVLVDENGRELTRALVTLNSYSGGIGPRIQFWIDGEWVPLAH